MDQVLSPGERYESIVEELQQLARSLLIFGLHVHVAVPGSIRSMIDLMNEARYFLPHLLALSTSSPFWMGRDTGLKSYRTTVFRRFPRTGVPDHFDSWSEYENYVKLLVELHCIDNAQEDLVGHAAASDVRHAGVPRLRRADARRRRRSCSPRWSRRSSSSCIGCARSNLGLPPLSPRADRREQVARRALGHRRQADRLRQAQPKCRCASSRSSCSSSSTTWWTSWGAGAVEYVHTILREGTSAERQLQVYRETGDLERSCAHCESTRHARAYSSADR